MIVSRPTYDNTVNILNRKFPTENNNALLSINRGLQIFDSDNYAGTKFNRSEIGLTFIPGTVAKVYAAFLTRHKRKETPALKVVTNV